MPAWRRLPNALQHIHERDDDHALVRTICTLARELFEAAGA